MSLKGKIEAIIYAAEEPVTLDQLRSLLGGEAAALLEARAQQQQRLPLHEVGRADFIPLPSEPDQLNDEVLDLPETDDEEAEEALGSVAEPELVLADEIEGVLVAETQIVLADETEGAPELLPAAAAEADVLPGALADEAPETPASATLTEADLTKATSALEVPPEIAPALDEKQLQRAARERERAIRELLREQIDELIRDYATGDRGLEIREVASGFRLATRPEYHDAVRGFARSLKPPLKLSLQALETLAVVAYKQPVTAPEVGEIRGVDSGGVLGSLMARKLVVPAGRKQVVGRPILYKTTKEFLLRFGLRDVSELPSIEEFEKLAGELADIEPLQEEISMSDSASSPADITSANLREEEDATEPQADGDDSTEAIEAMPLDGRIAGLSASTGEPADPSEAEADIQRDQQVATEGTED